MFNRKAATSNYFNCFWIADQILKKFSLFLLRGIRVYILHGSWEASLNFYANLVFPLNCCCIASLYNFSVKTSESVEILEKAWSVKVLAYGVKTIIFNTGELADKAVEKFDEYFYKRCNFPLNTTHGSLNQGSLCCIFPFHQQVCTSLAIYITKNIF